MENFKIAFFCEEFPDEPFPWFRSLAPAEVDAVRRRIAALLGLPNSASLQEMWQALVALEQHSIFLHDHHAEDERFSLSGALASQGIRPADSVYVNWRWYGLDAMDQFYFRDLDAKFEWIWYPGPDDIDLFDDSFSWIATIHHYGGISLFKARLPDDESGVAHSTRNSSQPI